MDSNFDTVLLVARERFIKANVLSPENKWEQIEQKDGYTIHTRVNPENGLKMNRTQVNLPFTPKEIADLIFDADQRPKYDERCVSIIILKKIDEHTLLFHQKGKAPVMFVSARDAVVVMRRINDGNEFTIISTSVEVPEVVVEKGFERAQVILSAFNLKPIGEGQTQVTVIGHINPMGNIPSAVTNAMAKQQSLTLKAMVKFLSEKKLGFAK